MDLRTFVRRSRPALLSLFLALAACGQTPEGTEEARGLIGGANVVLALSVIFIVVAVGIILGAVGLDRWVRSRREAEELPDTLEEEPEEVPVVAGIRQGSAGVPRWLYAVYVIIPVWALGYIVMNADIQSELGPAAQESPAPTDGAEGPQTEFTIVAENIQFDTDAFTMAANTTVQITLDNQDTVPHNVAIYETEDAQNPVFVGEIFTGPATRTEEFESPDPGDYYFQCDVHPGMNGTATFVEADAAPADGEGDTGDAAAPEIEVAANRLQFDTDTIQLPADTEVTIVFDNGDTVPHNIAIYRTEAATEPVFVGDLITNDTIEYTFQAPPAGEYYFQCDVHPGMNGTAVFR